MSSYQEKLKDPRWSAKRVTILLRDNFTCRWCRIVDDDERDSDGRKLVVLEVHHFEYPPPPLNPWECPDRDLVTLCSVCHDQVMRSHDREVKKTGERERERIDIRNQLREKGYWDAMDREDLRRDDRKQAREQLKDVIKHPFKPSPFTRPKELTQEEYEARMKLLREQAEELKRRESA